MEIDRLFTLSQFVEHIERFEYGINMYGVDCFDKVVDYNEFLKKPLKKEMFVCEVEVDEDLCFTDRHDEYDKQLDDLFEAEEKVIFDGFDVEPICTIRGHKECFYDKKMGWFALSDYKTLNDLAEATKGQLRLKNVEL